MTQTEFQKLLAAHDSFSSELDLLDNRELEVISLLSQGSTLQRIALEMGITDEALMTHKKTIQRKLGFRSDLQLLQFAARQRA